MTKAKTGSLDRAAGPRATHSAPDHVRSTLVAVRAAEPLIYRVSMAMEKLSVSRATIYRLAAAGDLKLIKIGKRASGITAESIRSLLDRGSVRH
jgi:predicted DNA-binding transcriptional regulator AlpA